MLRDDLGAYVHQYTYMVAGRVCICKHLWVSRDHLYMYAPIGQQEALVGQHETPVGQQEASVYVSIYRLVGALHQVSFMLEMLKHSKYSCKPVCQRRVFGSLDSVTSLGFYRLVPFSQKNGRAFSHIELKAITHRYFLYY